MRVIKVDDTNSVLIQDGSIQAWVDVSIEDKDVIADWNAYIFHKDNIHSMKLKEWQEDSNNFDEATSLAINHLEYIGRIAQKTDGTWVELDR